MLKDGFCAHCGQPFKIHEDADSVYFYPRVKGLVLAEPVTRCPRCGADLEEDEPVDTVEEVRAGQRVYTTAQLAELLGVTRGRILQLCSKSYPNPIPMRRVRPPAGSPYNVIDEQTFLAWARSEIERKHPGPDWLQRRLRRVLAEAASESERSGDVSAE